MKGVLTALKITAALLKCISAWLWFFFALAVMGVLVDVLAGLDATPQALLGLSVWGAIFGLAGSIVKKECDDYSDLTKPDED